MTSPPNTATPRSARVAPLAYALSLTLAAGLSASPDVHAMAVEAGLRTAAAPAMPVAATARSKGSANNGEAQEISLRYTDLDAEGRGRYIVVLQDPAAPEYAGSEPGLPRIPYRTNSPSRPRHLDMQSSAAQAYIRHLNNR